MRLKFHHILILVFCIYLKQSDANAQTMMTPHYTNFTIINDSCTDKTTYNVNVSPQSCQTKEMPSNNLRFSVSGIPYGGTNVTSVLKDITDQNGKSSGECSYQILTGACVIPPPLVDPTKPVRCKSGIPGYGCPCVCVQ